jgi:hypothetical protein
VCEVCGLHGSVSRDRRPPAHPDTLCERASYGYLLSATLQHERSGRDADYALNAGTLGHAEAQRLDASVGVVNRNDFQKLAGSDAIERTGLRRAPFDR